jgi:hypothetical protein
MTKAVELSLKQWAEIHQLIAKHYPPSVLLVRNRMKKVLGFTSRIHRSWISVSGYYTPVETIQLDFYDEPKRTMFLLRYSDIIGKTSLDSNIE